MYVRGIGNIIAGPISASLLRDEVRRGNYAACKYENMIIFTGAVMVMSALWIGFGFVRGRS